MPRSLLAVANGIPSYQYFLYYFSEFLSNIFVSFQNKVEGLTGLLVFDGSGLRTEVSFDLLELTPAGNQTVS